MNAIGFVELNSIAKGYETADAALKTSDIRLLSCHAGFPGKFYFLFKGYTSAVDMALKTAVSVGEGSIVDNTIIANVHEDVIKAMSMTTDVKLEGALGVMEFFSVTAAIYAADSAAKAADVKLVEIRTGYGIGGKSYVTMTGSVSAVNAAVSAGINNDNSMGNVVYSTVIPNPDQSLMETLY